MIPRKNWLEWTVFGLSTVLVLVTLGLLVHDALTPRHGPPDLHLSLGQAVQRSEGYVVPVTVRNASDVTAEAVQIEVELRHPAGRETGQFEVAFVPRQATREAFVVFEHDPREGQLRPRVLGFEQP